MDTDEHGLVVISLDLDEKSSEFVVDADAVVVDQGKTISGKTGGAFKVGPFALTVRGSDASSLEAEGSWLYKLGEKVSRSGHSDPPADVKWVIPPDKEAARKLKAKMRQGEPAQKTPKKSIDTDRIKLPKSRLLRIVQRSTRRSDPFRGTGFCSADNVCH